jgi:trimeric autotransporter adhesin
MALTKPSFSMIGVDAQENVYLGQDALATGTGGWNIAIGTDALSKNTTGNYGTAVGRWALKNNTQGQQNTGLGVDAMWGNTTGSYNVAIGTHAMVYANTGDYNVAIGKNALTGPYSGVSPNEVGAYIGHDCVAVGADALANNNANSNVAVGRQASLLNVTGTLNTHLGTNAGFTNGGANATTSGNKQVYLGNLSGQGVATSTQIDNAVSIGYNAQVLASNSCQIGDLNMVNFRFGNDIINASNNSLITYNDVASGYSVIGSANSNANGFARLELTAKTGGVASTTTISHSPSVHAKWLTTSADPVQIVAASNGVQLATGGTSWAAISDERLKDIIEPISNAVEKVSSLRSVIGKYKTDNADVRRPFLIAQDVQSVLPEALSTIKLPPESDDETEYLGVSYTDIIPLLVAAIKDLKTELDEYKQAHP